MANENDKIVGEGATGNGFKRVFEWLRNVFMGGSSGTGPILTVMAGAQLQASAVAMSRNMARMRFDDPVIKSRVASTKNKLSIFDGEIRVGVTEELKKAFHPENFDRMYWVMHCSTNVMLRIMADVCILYANPAKRSLKDLNKKTTQTAGATDATKALPSGQDSLKDQQKAADPAAAKGKPPEKGAPPAAKPGDKPAKAGGFPPPKAGPTPPTPDQAANGPQTGDPDIDALAAVLELTGSKDEADETPFDKLQKAYDLDVLLDVVERLCMICPVVWVRPIVTYDKSMQADATGAESMQNDASTGKLTYQIYTPDCADVVVDPSMPSEAIAFYYYGEQFNPTKGVIEKVIHFWTKTDYMKFDMEWKLIGLPEEHGMKRLPVTCFRINHPRVGYFTDNVGDDLREATLELNVVKTIQNSRAKDSGFKQMYITGDSRDMDQDQVMGGPVPIMLGDDNTAGVLDLQPALEQYTDMWEKREVSLAATYGINAATYKSEGHPQSGFAKKLDQDKVLKENKRRRKHFAKCEQDLYQNVATTIAEYPLPSIGTLDPAAEMEVDFAEPDFEEDPQTQAKTDAIELKFNSISIIDILRRKEPDLNEVELVEMAYKNKRINDAFMTTDQMKVADLLLATNVGGSVGGGTPAPPGGNGGLPGGEPAGGPPKPPFGGK